MQNALMVIYPYKYQGMWVFDDEAVGLVREPFVSGADDIIEKTLNQARQARLKILEQMGSVIDKPRASLSKYAPKVSIVKVPVEKIGEVIGPGGKIIRQIISSTGAVVDVDERRLDQRRDQPAGRRRDRGAGRAVL